MLVAEIVGDKLLYTTGVLATRFRPTPVMAGMATAFMAKMGVAVTLGQAVARLPPPLVATVTALCFVGVAYTLFRKPDTGQFVGETPGTPKAALVSFSAVFFSEWGDLGQITAASMAVRYSAPFVVWLGAVAAMVTKGILAALLGAGARRWIQQWMSPGTIRFGGVTIILALGLLSVLETLMRR